tara:strand:- start:134 stop:415 length:282 start_codon:yes stop_codon:yes gene_type:complete
MPRILGSTNTTNYHYHLKKYVDDNKTQIEEERYFKTQGEIQELYNMKRCSVYHLINCDGTTNKKKYKNIEIFKLSPPIAVYKQVEAMPNGILN